MGILFGELVDDMNGATCDAQSSASSRPDPFAYEPQINDKVLKLVYIAVGALVLIYTYVLCWSLVSQRLAARLRDAYFRSLLRQEPAFFDDRRAGEVSSRLHGDIQAVQSGTSEKVGILIASVSFFVTAYVVAFIKEASLAGMLVSLVPAFMIMAMIGAAFIQKFSGVMSDATAAASSIASEALSHVGIVQAFGAAPRLEAKFAGHMRIARAAGIKKAIAAAVQAGGLYFIAYSANSLAFWQGSRKVAALMEGRNDGASIGRIYTVVFILVDGTYTGLRENIRDTDGILDSMHRSRICRTSPAALWRCIVGFPATAQRHRAPLCYRRHFRGWRKLALRHPWLRRLQQCLLCLPFETQPLRPSQHQSHLPRRQAHRHRRAVRQRKVHDCSPCRPSPRSD